MKSGLIAGRICDFESGIACPYEQSVARTRTDPDAAGTDPFGSKKSQFGKMRDKGELNQSL